MRNRFGYHYREYKDFPRATALSDSLAKFSIFVELMLYAMIFLSILMVFTCETIFDYVSAAVIIVVLIAILIFMGKVYPKIADKIVNKVIENSIKRREQVKAAKPIADKNYDKKQELKKRIADLKKALKESDESYNTNKKILSEAYSDEELDRMLAKGQFSADKVKEYKDQRHNLEVMIDFMPSARKNLVRLIGDASKELAELECE